MSSSENKRSFRVGQQIQRELAALFVSGLKDPRIGFATVTEVRMTDDLRYAKVFVSIYGSDEERAATMKGLEAAAGFLRREVAQRLNLRHAPELAFEHDTTLDHAARIESLLSAAAQGETELPGPEGHDAVPVETLRNNVPKEPVPPAPPVGRRGRRKRPHARR